MNRTHPFGPIRRLASALAALGPQHLSCWPSPAAGAVRAGIAGKPELALLIVVPKTSGTTSRFSFAMGTSGVARAGAWPGRWLGWLGAPRVAAAGTVDLVWCGQAGQPGGRDGAEDNRRARR
jgi:hypothetical protein